MKEEGIIKKGEKVRTHFSRRKGGINDVRERKRWIKKEQEKQAVRPTDVEMNKVKWDKARSE